MISKNYTYKNLGHPLAAKGGTVTVNIKQINNTMR